MVGQRTDGCAVRAEGIYRRIKRRLEKLDLTEYSAAVRAGLSKDAIRNIRRTIEGDDPNRRGDVATRTVEALAPVLQTTPWWLIWEHGPEEASAAAISALPILGKVQAGIWLDTSIFDTTTRDRTVSAPRDPRFPGARHYCLDVVDDSVDEIYPAGSTVVCVDFADSDLKLKTGQVAHIERRREGQLVEVTLQEIRVDTAQTILEPRSSNKAYKPLRLGEADNPVEILVRGIVVSAITPAPVV